MHADDVLDQICAEHGLSAEFPEPVRAEVRDLVAAPGFDAPELVDLEHLPFATIDEVSSRDLDQALCIQQEGEQLVAWYAIADAAHFVPLGSALFAEGLRRGATAYLPGRVIPMLPAELSEGIVSLNPGVVRRARVWRMTIDADGVCLDTELIPARIRSRAKLDYDGVQAWLDGRAPDPCPDPGVLRSLALLPTVGGLRLTNADERGVVRYRRRELSVALADGGLSFVATGSDRNDVERFNEQLSLLCNVEGARRLQRALDLSGVLQPIYRVHEPPEDTELAHLEATLAELVVHHRLDPDRWSWTRASGQPLATFLDGLPHAGPEGRIAAAIHRQAVLLNRRSVYRAAPGPHHGVGAPVYGRFSAPMREIVGVFLHQELAELDAGRAQPLPEGAPDPGAVRRAVIEASSRSRSLQRTLDRQVNRAALDHLFRSSTEPLPGTVVGLSRGRLHVQLDEPPIDVKVYLRHLRQRHGELQLDEHAVALLRPDQPPLVRLGDGVRIRVLGPDGDTDRWALDLV